MERVYRLTARGVAPEMANLLEGQRILAARFMRDRVLVLGADHVLRLHEKDGSRTLDVDAFGPLSVQADRIAYTRGRMPDQEVAVLDVDTGHVITVTSDMAPAWSPALTPDGTEVVFASGASGRPRLYRAPVASLTAVGTLPDLRRFPTAPTPPRFDGSLLVFDDDQGTVWADLERGRIVHSEAR